jgi:hypothetical protein
MRMSRVVWGVLYALVFVLSAGCGGSDTFIPNDGGGDNGASLPWWNTESRSPAGAGAYLPELPSPILLGSTIWFGPVEYGTAGTTRIIPSPGDPDRSEIICSMISGTLIECTTTEFDAGVLDYTEDTRATPGAAAPTGTWMSADGFFPGGMDSSEAYAEFSPLINLISLTTYIEAAEGGLEARALLLNPDGVFEAGTTYEIGQAPDLSAAGFRFRFPLMGDATEVQEQATAGTLTITSAGSTLGATLAGTYSLTFPSGTTTGSFSAVILKVD